MLALTINEGAKLMFSQRQYIASKPTVLSDEMLNKVAGGKGPPIFYQETSPEGTTACRPAKAPLTTGNGGVFTINLDGSGNPIQCPPGGGEG